MSDLLQEAQVAKKTGNVTLAKQLISQALVQNPRNEAAWMLMSEVVDDARLKRNCLERALAINPQNTTASTALAKLNTSPLKPVSRGERDIPTSPPQLQTKPPFTPPFTWEGKQEEYLALGDMTYPEIAPDQPAGQGEAAPTFDWANDSPEPDKTIQKIFDAVSNPEQASQPLQDTDFKWMNDNQADEQVDTSLHTQDESEPLYEDQFTDNSETYVSEPRSTNPEDFSVSAEPQLGLSAFTSPDLPIESISSDYRLWDNPKGRQDRIIIVNNDELIYANPKEADVPHIVGLFNERKMLHDLLGENAKSIKLNTIKRLNVVPKKRRLTVEYKDERDKISKKQLEFSSPEVREDALDALKLRLGAGVAQTVQTFGMGDKVIPPVVTMLFVAFLAWGLIAGLPMLASTDPTQLGALLGVINVLQSFVSMVGSTNILLVAAVLILLAVIWLLNNLRQPSKLIIIHR